MQREIVIRRSAIVVLVGLLAYLGARYGVPVDDATRDTIVNVLALVLPVVLPLGAALWARLGVTPVYDPRDDAGRALVPAVVGDQAPTVPVPAPADADQAPADPDQGPAVALDD